MAKRLSIEADWNTWAFMPTTTLQEAVFLSLDLEPVSQGFNHALVVACKHIDEADPLRMLREFNRRMKIASANIKELAESPMAYHRDICNAEVSLSKFGTWAGNIGLSLPDKFPTQTAPEKPIDAPAQSPATPAPVIAASDGPALPTFFHSTKVRRDALTPVIELAQSHCRNASDTAEVWAALLVLAEKKTAPLIGATEDGLQYLKKGTAASFNREALRKRLGR